MFRSLIPLRRDRKHRPTLSETTFQPCNIPPLLIVIAISDYHARSSEQLSFRKGDLFHVINNSHPEFYQVCNPLSNEVGMAPTELFRAFDKKARATSASLIPPPSHTINSFHSLTSKFSTALEARTVHSSPWSLKSPLYRTPLPTSNIPPLSFSLKAIGLYTFTPERDDELGFEQGDQLIVVARSTSDWLVARVQSSTNFGLVPSTYLQLTDIRTGESYPGLEKKLPSVKAWKQSFQLDGHRISTVPSNTSSIHSAPSLESHSPSSLHSSYLTTPTTPVDHLSVELAQAYPLDTAHVTSFFRDAAGYTFVIVLKFESAQVQRTLYRDYTDFYNFHLALLKNFPCEAGRTGDRRVLPFMPGPLDEINEEITSQRRLDLDLYVQQLFVLPSHIQRTDLFRNFFLIRKNDYERPFSSSIPSPPSDLQVKVTFQSDHYAFKLPANASNFDIHEKICLRFGDAITDLYYLDANGQQCPLDLTVPLHHIAKTQSGKLRLFAT